MPLPINPNQPHNDDENENGKKDSRSDVTPPKRGLPLQRPGSFNSKLPTNRPHKSLDETVGSGSSSGRRRDLGSGAALTGISVEEVLDVDYNKTFKKLENKVLEVKTWLQNHISEVKLIERVGKARAERGESLIEMKTTLEKILVTYSTKNPWGTPQEISKVSSIVINEILGFGPLEPLWNDPSITEIMVNGPEKVYIERQGKLRRAYGIQFRDAGHLLELCQQMFGQIGRTLDVAHNRQDGRLPDGSRINATHPIIGAGVPYLTIRRFPEEVFTLRKLMEVGSFTNEMAEEIGNLIYHRSSVIVSGGTGSGKTSMLNALSGCIPNDERIVTVEDNLELRLHPDKHVVAVESRQAQQGEENALGNVTIRDLVKNSLRQRPDRIIVGEVRDGAAYDMLQAFNTGHEGSMSTIHANNPRAAIERLSNLVAQVGELSADQALTLISSSVGLIIQVARYEDGSRRVSEVVEIPSRVSSENNRIALEPIVLWEFQQTGVDENNRIVGDYVKVNDLSDEYVKVNRLDKRRRISLAELLSISDLPENHK